MALELAAELMADFASDTGLAPDSPEPPRRYLWTDAFAVCNYLELWRITGDDAHRSHAERLVEEVHDVLGRTREPGGARLGDADDDHPTRGGLRIGKPRPERGPDEPFDPHQEWERDGQYFHYLTKWMHALDQAAHATARPELNVWARELADTAYRAFASVEDGSAPTMAWKMSTDLRRALVPAAGRHDPLEGLVTYVQLEASAAALGASRVGPDLGDAIEGFRAMLDATEWVTDDPLGIGGLLGDACRIAQLQRLDELDDDDLLLRLLASAYISVRHWSGHTQMHQPAARRLAFRELGLCIGLHGIDLVRAQSAASARELDDLGGAETILGALARFVPLAPAIEAFWAAPEHRSAVHRDIDRVMLATSLLPRGYLWLGVSPRGGQPAVSSPTSVSTPHTPSTSEASPPATGST